MFNFCINLTIKQNYHESVAKDSFRSQTTDLANQNPGRQRHVNLREYARFSSDLRNLATIHKLSNVCRSLKIHHYTHFSQCACSEYFIQCLPRAVTSNDYICHRYNQTAQQLRFTGFVYLHFPLLNYAFKSLLLYKMLHSPLNPTIDFNTTEAQIWSGLQGSATALAIAQFANKHNAMVTVLTGSSREADVLTDALKFYCDDVKECPIHKFPSWECLPYDTFSPHQEILSQRIHLLSILPSLASGILVVAADTLMQRLPPTDFIESNSFTFETGALLNVEGFRKRMNRISYRSVQQVEDPGEYVIRGGVIDVFTMGANFPIRIELFGDQIETIRHFDPVTQLSTEKINSFEIFPGSEISMTEEAIRLFRQGIREHIDADPRQNTVYNEIDSQQIPNGAEYYLPLFFPETSNLLDYLETRSHWFVSESFDESTQQFWNQISERFQYAGELSERLPLPPEMLYFSPKEISNLIASNSHTRYQSALLSHSVQFESRQPVEFNIQDRSTMMQSLLDKTFNSSASRNLICVESIGQEQLLENLFSKININITRLDSWKEFLNHSVKNAICVSTLPMGLYLPTEGLRVLASQELFGNRSRPQNKPERARNPESLISSMDELDFDELVVHEQYGIGLYKGLLTMNVSGGGEEEFLSIRYRDNQTLYVPVYAIDVLSRYIGAKPEEVVLNSLSSKSWETSQRKAKEHAFDLAAELVEIQTLRDARQGNAMPVPTSDYQLLVSRFPYQETPDQQKAINAVLHDLNSNRPMDRLVCGDVGFGKTEVALRGSLVAIANGYQVAIIVPTTLLAQQHFDVFQDRFTEFGIEVKLLSRMVKTAQAKEVVEQLQSGKIDIVIGTHRLLQSDIKFFNLGLVIIDEEHRFGVRQKEHLKKLRAEVDILTMTATPIPRTLSMVLNEIRDISIIATPPDNRLSIRTFVRNWNPDIVREACLRELGRGGQIFYVHNEVKSIQYAAKEIARIVPEANIGIAHGQMPKLQLENVMRNFYLQKFDLLVCSTIIESGIDVPTANTIIIDRASNFGLAQLHQLRGRVGRSHHQAYAYLLVSSKEYLRSDARRRLEAIETFDQLGMGYVIATHDLEIRGAGALLGESQSGVMNEVGYSMYSQILKESVKTLKHTSWKEEQDTIGFEQRRSVEINLHVSALLPETWIPNVNLRLKLYRRIASVDSRSALNEIKYEMVDRFGKLPEQVEHLFNVHNLKHWCEQLGILKLTIGQKSGKIVFRHDTEISLEGLTSLVNEYDGKVKLNPADSTLHLSHLLPSKNSRISAAFQILEQLTPNRGETVDQAISA